MKPAIEKALYHSTHARDLQIAGGTLRELTASYPYFAPAHVLLGLEMKENQDPGWRAQLQKSALFFNNILWMQYLVPAEHADALPLRTQAVIPEGTAAGEDTVIADEPASPQLHALLSEQAAEFRKPVEDARLPFEKEPYHTIDYFASQGIKTDTSRDSADKLGKQLLSFTDWLKKIRQTGPENHDFSASSDTEAAIQTSAQTSNETKEVITEAMAEVLARQGKIAKAVELYHKLSFLDPSKSAYFAAKIEQLKEV